MSHIYSFAKLFVKSLREIWSGRSNEPVRGTTRIVPIE